MKAGNNIDGFFRDAMTDYKVEPSVGLWRRIERRIFPPSQFSPSSLITSGILIFIAGLMPWILIPANGGEQNEPELRPAGTTRGYILNPTDEDFRIQAVSARTYSVQTTYFKEETAKKETAGLSSVDATLKTAMEEASGLLIADAGQNSAYFSSLEEYSDETLLRASPWYYRMHSHPAGLMDPRYYNTALPEMRTPTVQSALSEGYENDYFKKSELSLGMSFNPSIVFYDPNPANEMLGGEANVRYQVSNWYFQGGLGYSSMEDVGSYKVNYKTNDSVGYFINVISFTPDPRDPGNVIYTIRQEAIYDSVEHYSISDKTNHYSYLDVPVSVGYTFFRNGRLTFAANAGIKFSVLLAKDEPTVEFTVPNGELIEIERQVPVRTNTNWRFTAGLDFGYLITSKVSLNVEPVFEQYISPLYESQSGIKPKKPIVTGLKAGFRYTF
jgi:hypothetical protein